MLYKLLLFKSFGESGTSSLPQQTQRQKEPEPQPSRSENIAVYRNEACQAVFSSPKNAGLRTKKPIKSLINENHLSVAGLSNERLNAILRSLQEDRIFQSPISIQAAFPELRPSEPVEPAPITAPASVPTKAKATMEPTVRRKRELLKSLHRIYLTGDYLDTTIASATRNYPDHRAIEGFEGVITLHDNEPLVVDMMLQYVYLLDYKPAHDHSLQLAESKQNASAPGLLHTKAYAIADSYAIAGLKALAVVKFKSSAGEA
uniref:BTB domain-containing protein n=1 Tax=Pyricularia oryzae (strain P131) TaxID=1143193 RepID=L7JRK6_PYRO1